MDPAMIAMELATTLITTFGPELAKLLFAPDAIEALAKERVETILPSVGSLEFAMLHERAARAGVTEAHVTAALNVLAGAGKP
jgi:hypothetical protein